LSLFSFQDQTPPFFFTDGQILTMYMTTSSSCHHKFHQNNALPTDMFVSFSVTRVAPCQVLRRISRSMQFYSKTVAAAKRIKFDLGRNTVFKQTITEQGKFSEENEQ
jgi:hypothetical protein